VELALGLLKYSSLLPVLKRESFVWRNGFVEWIGISGDLVVLALGRENFICLGLAPVNLWQGFQCWEILS
jgi:hypothetical protein